MSTRTTIKDADGHDKFAESSSDAAAIIAGEHETPRSESTSLSSSSGARPHSVSDSTHRASTMSETGSRTSNTYTTSSATTTSEKHGDIKEERVLSTDHFHSNPKPTTTAADTAIAITTNTFDHPQQDDNEIDRSSIPGAYRVSLQRLARLRDDISEEDANVVPDGRNRQPAASSYQPAAANIEEALLVEATVVNDDDDEEAESHWTGDVYDAVLLLPRRNVGLVVATLTVVMAIILGVTIPLTTRRQVAPRPVDPNASSSNQSALAWIKGSTVELVARQLPAATIATIQQDMKRVNRNVTTSNADINATSWYNDELWDDNNYQPLASSARAWKGLVSSSSVANLTVSDVTTRFALAAFYFSTGGPAWLNNTNWLVASQHVCDWYMSLPTTTQNIDEYRTECLENGLTQLVLNNNSLIGELPDEIGLLTTLTTMEITGHRSLGGFLPISLSQLTRLTRLTLQANNFVGELPSELGLLTKLKDFNTQGSSLTGPVPSAMASLTALTSVALTFVDISIDGDFPDAEHFGNWTKLRYLSMDSMVPLEEQFTPFDNFTTSIGLATNLESLSLRNFRLDGSVPSEIGRLTKLTTLSLSGTFLGGSLPDTIASLINLQNLTLDRNRLSGTISDTLVASWRKMTSLRLNDNRFTGTLSTNIGLLTNSQDVWLQDNQFSGTLPTELGLLTSTTQLLMRRNLFSGQVPSQLSSLSKITALDLDSMPQLSGVMPTELCDRTLRGQDPLKFWIECSANLTCDGCCIKSSASGSDDAVYGDDDSLFGPCVVY